MPVNFVSNPGFEEPRLQPGQWFPLVGSEPGWEGTGKFGIACGISAWGRCAHGGNQYGFLQMASSCRQIVTGIEIGHEYQVTLWIAKRSGDMGADYGHPISVRINDQVVLGPVFPTSDGEWGKVESATFVAASETAEIIIVGHGTDEDDTTTLIDDVSLHRVD
jgi:hypothetical protein